MTVLRPADERYAYGKCDQLSGLSDVNKTRKKTTTEYIRNCEAALIVAPIARVETDSQVHKRLGQYHRMFGNKKAMVVTKSDVISQLLIRYS